METAEEITPRRLRCILGGEVFDFNQDLGAIEMGRQQAACTNCLDKLFAASIALYPSGERPQSTPKARKKHEAFRHKARKVA